MTKLNNLIIQNAFTLFLNSNQQSKLLNLNKTSLQNYIKSEQLKSFCLQLKRNLLL